MACVPQFEPSLNFECVREIIADARTGSVTTATVQKGIWTAGCALQLMAPLSPVAGLADEPVDASSISTMTVEQLCDSLEPLTFAHDSGIVESVATVNPATILMILQLVMKLLEQFKK